MKNEFSSARPEGVKELFGGQFQIFVNARRDHQAVAVAKLVSGDA